MLPELQDMVKDNGKRQKQEIRDLKKKVRGLKAELNRKDKALAETAALLVLKKKLNLLMGEKEDD
jgi:cell division septum initiation protein DivIVA